MWPRSDMLDKPCIFIIALSHAPPSIYLRTENPRTPAELLRRSDVITPGCVCALWYGIGLSDSSGLDFYGPRWIFIGASGKDSNASDAACQLCASGRRFAPTWGELYSVLAGPTTKAPASYSSGGSDGVTCTAGDQSPPGASTACTSDRA